MSDAIKPNTLPDNSQLEQLIAEHLNAAPTFPLAFSARTVFLPWYSPAEHGAAEQVRQLALRLGMKAVIMPSHYSLTHDARLLGQLIEAVCEDADEAKVLEEALQKLPYTASLERTILFRLRKHLEDRLKEKGVVKRIAVAALKTGSEADSSISRLLDWIRPLPLGAILVFAHRRPSGIVETISLPVQRMVQDVVRLVPDMEPSIDQKSTTADGRLSGIQPQSDEPEEASFYSRLRAHLLSFMQPDKPQGDGSQVPITESTGGSGNERRERRGSGVAAWAELLTRLAGANWAAAEQVSTQWRLVGEKVRNIDKPKDDHALYLDNKEERETFQGRLRFLVMLRVLYPQAFAAAAHELDGADQLYRIHLTLCGATAADSLLAHSLLPFWQNHFEDPLFCELFYACFLTMDGDRPLSERFESRAQLHHLLLWLERSEHDERLATRPATDLLSSHQRWLQDLSSIDSKDDSAPRRCKEDVARVINEANRKAVAHVLRMAKDVSERDPSCTEAMQAAQTLMSMCELMTEQDFDSSKALFELIDALTKKAINQSAGAIRVDASLLRARALVLRGESVAALEILRIIRRTARDALGRCATQVEEAYVHEREMDYVRAITLYEGAMSIAEELGADELVARTASGCLRCDALAESHKLNCNQDPGEQRERKAEILHMRTRIALQIQCARAPELFPLSRRNKPTLFISYRAETRSVTRAIVNALNDDKSILKAWADVELESHQDFNPTIHRRLHDADAIIIVLSPEYFDSSWCVAELHFALSQNETRGVPLCWLWCMPELVSGVGETLPPASIGGDKDLPCQTLAWQGIRGSLQRVALSSRGHEQAHLEDRLRRIFARGRLLHDKPVVFEKNEVDPDGRPLGEPKQFPAERADVLCKPLFDMASSLYALAKLPLTIGSGCTFRTR